MTYEHSDNYLFTDDYHLEHAAKGQSWTDHGYINKYVNKNGKTVYVYPQTKYAFDEAYRSANGDSKKRANLGKGTPINGPQRDRRTQGNTSREGYKARQRRAAARDAMRERQEANQRLEERRKQSQYNDAINKNQAAMGKNYGRGSATTNLSTLDKLKYKGKHIVDDIVKSYKNTVKEFKNRGHRIYARRSNKPITDDWQLERLRTHTKKMKEAVKSGIAKSNNRK